MECPRCNSRANTRDRFCQDCGAQLATRGSLPIKGVVVVLVAAAALATLYLVVSSRTKPDNKLLVMGAAHTDSRGEAHVPTIGTVEVTDTGGRPLAGIDVSVFSGAARWLLVVRDPRRSHKPALAHGKLGALAASWTDSPGGAPGLAAIVRPVQAGGRIPVRLSPVARSVTRELGGPVAALADYLEDPPSLLTDTGTYRVECQTEAQMVASYRLVSTVVLIPLKLAGGILSSALQKGSNTLGYVGITDEGLLRLVIRELYGRHDRYKVGYPTTSTVFDQSDSNELVRWSQPQKLDPTNQEQRPVWSVLGSCEETSSPDSRLPSPVVIRKTTPAKAVPPPRPEPGKGHPEKVDRDRVVSVTTVPSLPVRWRSVAPLPVPVTTHAMASSGQMVYVIGGTTESGSPPAPNSAVFYARVSADGGVSAWQRTQSPGGNWHNLDAVAYRGAVYAAGGSNGYGALARVMVSEINAADGSLGQWRSARSLPSSQENGALAAHRGHLYLIGGRNSSCYHARVQQDHGLAPWRSCTALPGRSSNQHGAAVSGGRLYYFRNEGQRALLVADIGQDGSLGAWRSIRLSFSDPVGVAISVGSRLVVSGRMSSGLPSSGTFFSRLGAGGLAGTWHRLPALPRPRSGHDGVAVGRYMVVGGGTGPGQQGYAGTRQVYTLGPL